MKNQYAGFGWGPSGLLPNTVTTMGTPSPRPSWSRLRASGGGGGGGQWKVYDVFGLKL